MKISCHCLVKNEENFIWYAINSVIDHVDEILVWDTGSTDKTIEIIKTINNPKVKFRQYVQSNPNDIANPRQQMLNETNADYVLILDGDEIWYEEGIKDLLNSVKKFKDKKVFVSKFKMLIGDIFHYQSDSAGAYRIHDKKGNLTVRLFSTDIRGLHVDREWPYEGYAGEKNVRIQEMSLQDMYFDNNYYLHTSYLERTNLHKNKFKYEIGNSFPLDFYYPEVFFKNRPGIVPSAWRNMNKDYKLKALWQTPLKVIKRKII